MLTSNMTRMAAVLLAASLAAPAAALGGDRDAARERREQREHAERVAREERRETAQQREERRELEKQLRLARREFQAAARKLQELQAQIAAEEAEARAAAMAKLFQVSRRGRLGVVVDTTPEKGQGSEGAVVVAVTPGTPAEKAGLRPGDLIVRMNGEELTDGGARPGRSPAALELIRRARGIQPGEKVSLEYRRGDDNGVVVLEAAPAEGPRFNFMISPRVEIPAVQFEAWPYALLEAEPPDEETVRKWRQFELVELNPDLGRYFGSGRGVLVVRAPEEPPLDVKAGDVIIGIGGRETDTPLEAVRSLRTVRPGERIELKLLRDGSVMTVRTRVPELPEPAGLGDRKD